MSAESPSFEKTKSNENTQTQPKESYNQQNLEEQNEEIRRLQKKEEQQKSDKNEVYNALVEAFKRNLPSNEVTKRQEDNQQNIPTEKTNISQGTTNTPASNLDQGSTTPSNIPPTPQTITDNSGNALITNDSTIQWQTRTDYKKNPGRDEGGI